MPKDIRGEINRARIQICFICPGLEPGKDAVGDYTVEIGHRLLAMGWSVYIVALADRYVDVTTEGERAGCQTLRLPEKSSSVLRWQQLADCVQETKPNWVSIQWVSYGFHPKGLPFGFGAALKRAAGSCLIHIMFHEIWVGSNPQANVKERVLGMVQRKLHRKLLKQLKPSLVHTHAAPYRLCLSELGAPAKILPLASNISGDTAPADSAFVDLLNAHGLEDTAETKVFIILGNVPPEWTADALFKQLGRYGVSKNLAPLVFFCGKGGSLESRREEFSQIATATGIRCLFAGFQSEAVIAACFQRADFGVATVPFALWEKSSAVAAMRTFGLPVIFTRFDGAWPQACLPAWLPEFLRCDATSEFVEALDVQRKTAKRDLWEETAAQFRKDCRLA